MLKDKDYNDGMRDSTQCSPCPSCCKGCCRHTCCVCPPKKPEPGAFSGIQAQLQGAAGEILENNSNIMFDKVLNHSNPGIQYNSGTGEFILPPNKNYYVSWEVAIDGTDVTQSVDFGVAVNGFLAAVSSSTQVTCLLTGTALVTTGKEPGKLTVMNVSENTVRYAATTVQVNIVIIGPA